MGVSSDTAWRRGELYRSLCLLWIGVCVWMIGSQLDVFATLQRLSIEYGATDLVMLGCIMSFALAAASTLRSFDLRRMMAEREEAETRAQALARHDPMTGLANRRRLQEVANSPPGVEAGLLRALLLIDLDRFKPVNDIYGHAAGDAVLCEVATRLKELTDKTDLVARLGGDEFAVFTTATEKHDLMRLAQQVITAVGEPFLFEASRIEIGATVGIAIAGTDGPDAVALLRSADIALYRGKREGRNTYRFFEQSMDEELRERAALEAELRSAIEAGGIKPHYQPLVSLDNQRLLGFEVLARWYHPTRGVLPPSLFIDIAEDTGVIAELSYKLLKEACLDAKAWPPHLRLAVNISPIQLKDRWLPERILSILTETGFAPARLEIEITETALAQDIEAARIALASLQNNGIKIALDDFGTGYSSLYHLRELRFDKIKIDRSFVSTMRQDSESTKIVDAIISLGKSLGMDTTAEGIEDDVNLAWLAEQGCTFGQGYLFGKPMSAETVGTFIEGQRSETMTITAPVRAIDTKRNAA